MLDYTIENLRGMVGFVSMAKNSQYSSVERHGFLMFAVMHACQAAIHGDSDPSRYGMTLHDYKHKLIKVAEAVMDGQTLDEVIGNVEEYPLAKSIDWNYFHIDVTFYRLLRKGSDNESNLTLAILGVPVHLG